MLERSGWQSQTTMLHCGVSFFCSKDPCPKPLFLFIACPSSPRPYACPLIAADPLAAPSASRQRWRSSSVPTRTPANRRGSGYSSGRRSPQTVARHSVPTRRQSRIAESVVAPAPAPAPAPCRHRRGMGMGTIRRDGTLARVARPSELRRLRGRRLRRGGSST